MSTAPTPPISTKDEDSNGSQPQPQQQLPSTSSSSNEEDRLGRAWRSLASTVVLATQKTEKAANMRPQPSKESLKELDDAVVSFLRMRMEWGRQIYHVERKIQGKEQEMETTDCYLRSQPRLGKKRKRLAVGTDGNHDDTDDKDGSIPKEEIGAIGIAEAVNAVAAVDNHPPS
mgnify:CR=1 FL=1